jgi:hypothetical protein
MTDPPRRLDQRPRTRRQSREFEANPKNKPNCPCPRQGNDRGQEQCLNHESLSFRDATRNPRAAFLAQFQRSPFTRLMRSSPALGCAAISRRARLPLGRSSREASRQSGPGAFNPRSASPTLPGNQAVSGNLSEPEKGLRHLGVNWPPKSDSLLVHPNTEGFASARSGDLPS